LRKCPKNNSKVSPRLLVRPDRSKLAPSRCLLAHIQQHERSTLLFASFLIPQLTNTQQPLRLSTNQLQSVRLSVRDKTDAMRVVGKVRGTIR